MKNKNNSYSFRLYYEGKAVETGSMDVYDLAPALMSLGDSIRIANEVLNGREHTIKVNINSDFKTGSFGIDLQLQQFFIEQITSFLTNQGYTPEQIIKFIGLCILGVGGATATGLGALASLVKVIEHLKGKPPSQTIINIESVTITNQDGEKIETSKEVEKLLQHREMRSSIYGVVKPLEKEDYSNISSDDDKSSRVPIIKSGSAIYYRVPEPTEKVRPTLTATEVLEIVKPSFNDKLSWRFNDGSGSFEAKIEDEAFWKKINDREIPLYSGDALEVDVETTQKLIEGKLRKTKVIKKVYQVKPGYQQDSLFDNNAEK